MAGDLHVNETTVAEMASAYVEPEYVELVRKALPSIRGGQGIGNGSAGGKVYKDECTFGFDTPRSEDGVYVSLLTMQVRFIIRSDT